MQLDPGGKNASDALEPVIEKMAVTERITLAIEKLPEGKIRVGASSWPDAKVVLKGEVLEVRDIDGQLRVSRKVRHHDQDDPPIEPYDPNRTYGDDDVIEDEGAPADMHVGAKLTSDDTHVARSDTHVGE